ncbi:MAG: ABC transporter permease [Phycisphaerales bacterium]
MLGLIVRRLLQFPLILGAVLAITLTLAWAVPGNPLERADGRRPAPEVARAMRAQYNLDSFPAFFASYFLNASGARAVGETFGWIDPPAGNGPARPVFDLGPSLEYRDRRVSEIIAGALPVSMTLGAGAMVLAVFIGLTAGIIGAVRPGSLADHLALGVALIGVSLPSFVVGTVLLLIFCVSWKVLPLGWSSPSSAILPMLTLALPPAAYIARLSRMSMIESLGAEYVRTARAKGLAESRVVLTHALKNAVLPVLSYLGPAAALAMTGSFVVEKVFLVPGMGQHFVNAVLNKDLFLILGVVLVYATLLIVLNLIVDVLYCWVDPRIGTAAPRA